MSGQINFIIIINVWVNHTEKIEDIEKKSI